MHGKSIPVTDAEHLVSRSSLHELTLQEQCESNRRAPSSHDTIQGVRRYFVIQGVQNW